MIYNLLTIYVIISYLIIGGIYLYINQKQKIQNIEYIMIAASPITLPIAIIFGIVFYQRDKRKGN